jgi:ureidoacrylate peracid hydrolase
MPHAVDHHAILDKLAATRGGVRNSFDVFDPARTAHLVVDMQNGFMEQGAPVEVPAARSIVDNINRLSRAIRATGGTNVFLRFTTTDLDGAWSVFGRGWAPSSPRSTRRRSSPARTITSSGRLSRWPKATW